MCLTWKCDKLHQHGVHSFWSLQNRKQNVVLLQQNSKQQMEIVYITENVFKYATVAYCDINGRS